MKFSIISEGTYWMKCVSKKRNSRWWIWAFM